MNKPMTKLRFLFLCSIFAFSFLGCDDDFWKFPSKYKDESLTLTMDSSRNDKEGTTTVTFKKCSDADGVIYTTDDSEPSAEYEEDADGHLSYSGEKPSFDKDTAKVTVKKSCTVRAIAYRIDKSLETAKYGNEQTESVEVDEFVSYKFRYTGKESNGAYKFITDDKFSFKTSDGELLSNCKFEMHFYPDTSYIGTWELSLYHDDSELYRNYFARGVYESPTCFKGATPTDGNLKFSTTERVNLKTVTAKFDSSSNFVFTLPMNMYFFDKCSE